MDNTREIAVGMTVAVEELLSETVDLMASCPAETKQVRSAAWQQFLIYVPKAELEARLAKMQQ